MADNLTFTGLQAAMVQTALREVLGLPPEEFSVQAFIGMVSDEIEQLRASGRNDVVIADLISKAAGKVVSADAIVRFYASPETRGHHGE